MPPGTIEGERAIKIHPPMLLKDPWWGLLSLDPFGHEILHGLGLDRCLWHVGYVEPH
jgi:hypothetical protein